MSPFKLAGPGTSRTASAGDPEPAPADRQAAEDESVRRYNALERSRTVSPVALTVGFGAFALALTAGGPVALAAGLGVVLWLGTAVALEAHLARVVK